MNNSPAVSSPERCAGKKQTACGTLSYFSWAQNQGLKVLTTPSYSYPEEVSNGPLLSRCCPWACVLSALTPAPRSRLQESCVNPPLKYNLARPGKDGGVSAEAAEASPWGQ